MEFLAAISGGRLTFTPRRETGRMRPRVCDSAEDLCILNGAAAVDRKSRATSKAFHSQQPLRHRFRTKAGEELSDSNVDGQDQAYAASRSWDSITQRLVGLSMLPFLVLLVPQFIRNWGFLLSGNPQALASLSWLGYVTGLGGNTLLLSYFTAKRETSAVCVQAVGIASAFAVLTQMRVALCIPRAIYLGVAIVVGATTILTGLKLSGCLEGSKAGQHLWTVWQKALGLTGLFAVPQVLCATFSVDIWIPTAVITAAGCILAAGEALGAPLPPSLRNAWGSLSAWTATLLFMLQPVAQLLRNFTAPAGLESLSVATVAFAALGNALMVPRALWTGDTVWLVGSSWGALVFGWCQLFSLYLGTTASGQRILGHAPFMAATVILWGWLIGTSAYSITLRGKQARRGAQ